MDVLRALFAGRPTRPSVGEVYEAFGAAVVGASHVAAGLPCQDYFVCETGPGWAVAVVSDGAGSATRALDGARIISKELCQALSSHIREVSKDSPMNAAELALIQSVVIEGVEQARRQCLNEAREGETLRAFHATVVGGILLDQGGVLFHIGDGGASAHRRTGDDIETLAFSEPENGEYINQTFFFTEDWWREHLRFTSVPKDVDAVWLMTDGAYQLMVPLQEKYIRNLTEKEIERLVFAEAPAKKPALLAEILSSPQAADRNDDDKTLVIVRRKKRDAVS